jgi:hypothetical protein
MVNKLFDFFPFGRRKPARVPASAARREDAAPPKPALEDLGEILTGERPAPHAPGIPFEPPTVVLPPEADPQLKAGFRSVKDSVDTLKQRAMTARQLREAIEHTIESRVGDLRATVDRIQELFNAQATAARPASGEAAERLGERLGALETRLEAMARDLPGAIVGALGDVPGAVAKLAEDLASRDARMLAWLERISVQGYAAARDVAKTAAEQAAQRALLEEARRERVRVEALRKKLYAVRDRLAAGVAGMRDGATRNLVSRALLARRIEAALGPFQAAIEALETLIKELE